MHHRTKGLTSTQCHDVLQPKPLGLLQMPCDVILGLIAACHVQDGLQATVADCCIGNNHGRCFLVRSWVPCRVPCHINEEWTTCSHAVKPVDFRTVLAYQVTNSPHCAWDTLLLECQQQAESAWMTAAGETKKIVELGV